MAEEIIAAKIIFEEKGGVAAGRAPDKEKDDALRDIARTLRFSGGLFAKLSQLLTLGIPVSIIGMSGLAASQFLGAFRELENLKVLDQQGQKLVEEFQEILERDRQQRELYGPRDEDQQNKEDERVSQVIETGGVQELLEEARRQREIVTEGPLQDRAPASRRLIEINERINQLQIENGRELSKSLEINKQITEEATQVADALDAQEYIARQLNDIYADNKVSMEEMNNLAEVLAASYGFAADEARAFTQNILAAKNAQEALARLQQSNAKEYIAAYRSIYGVKPDSKDNDVSRSTTYTATVGGQTYRGKTVSTGSLGKKFVGVRSVSPGSGIG